MKPKYYSSLKRFVKRQTPICRHADYRLHTDEGVVHKEVELEAKGDKENEEDISKVMQMGRLFRTSKKNGAACTASNKMCLLLSTNPTF